MFSSIELLKQIILSTLVHESQEMQFITVEPDKHLMNLLAYLLAFIL